jgi:hypothetical protein
MIRKLVDRNRVDDKNDDERKRDQRKPGENEIEKRAVVILALEHAQKILLALTRGSKILRVWRQTNYRFFARAMCFLQRRWRRGAVNTCLYK